MRSLFALFAPFLFISGSSAQSNRTIDDQLGDSITGEEVVYLPALFNGGLVWRGSNNCAVCAITPDDSKTFDNTWTSATYFADQGMGNISIGFNFKGTAIYIYFVQSNVPAETSEVSSTFCDFYVDNKNVGRYQHVTDGTSTFQYDVLAYSATSLPNANHTFLIDTTGSNNSYTIFDYAIYTSDEVDPVTTSSPTSTSSSPISSVTSSITSVPHKAKSSAGAIVGGVVGGVVGLGIIVALGILLNRRRKSKVSSAIEKPRPFDLTEAGPSEEQFKTLGLDEDGMQEGLAGTSGLTGRLPVKTRSAWAPPSQSSGVLTAPSSNPTSSPSVPSSVSSPSAGMTGTPTRKQRAPVEQLNPPSTEPHTMVHKDSGLRLNSTSGVIELPPVYAAE